MITRSGSWRSMKCSTLKVINAKTGASAPVKAYQERTETRAIEGQLNEAVQRQLKGSETPTDLNVCGAFLYFVADFEC